MQRKEIGVPEIESFALQMVLKALENISTTVSELDRVATYFNIKATHHVYACGSQPEKAIVAVEFEYQGAGKVVAYCPMFNVDGWQPEKVHLIFGARRWEVGLEVKNMRFSVVARVEKTLPTAVNSA
jgi:hypothetical protein